MRAKPQSASQSDGRQQLPEASLRSTAQINRAGGNSSQDRSTNRTSQAITQIQADRSRSSGRLAEIKLDPMELIQSVSRSGGDGAEGDA